MNTKMTLPIVAASLIALGALGLGCFGSSEQGDGEIAEAEQATGFSSFNACWAATTVRGAGVIPSTCPGEEKDGALCYPLCKAGYDGVGPVCWEICPADAHDDGAFCRRDAKIISANTSACPWYDACGLTFAKGCSKCPSGYRNDGCTCRKDVQIWAKKSYGRGAGTPMECPASRPDEDAGLCYVSCAADQTGVGPVCWHDCPSSFPVACGAACAVDQAECGELLFEQIKTPVELGLELVDGDPQAIVTALELANAYGLPICGD